MVNEYKETRLYSISPTSVNIELRSLRSVFSYALKKKYVKENPFSCFEKAKEESNELPLFMKIEEVKKILSTIEASKDYSFLKYVLFLLHTGARRNEALNIKKEHIDYEKRRISLIKTKTKRPRYVPIDDVVYDIVKAMPDDEEFLFNYHYDTVTHKFKKYIRKAGLPDNYSLKTTRKTFASHLVMQGINLTTVQELLGHSSPETTRKHYAKLADEHLQQSVKKLPY
jgi:integrase